jgi:hypothetical protein
MLFERVMRTVASRVIALIQSAAVSHLIVSPIWLIMPQSGQCRNAKSVSSHFTPNLPGRIVVLRAHLEVRQGEELPEWGGGHQW